MGSHCNGIGGFCGTCARETFNFPKMNRFVLNAQRTLNCIGFVCLLSTKKNFTSIILKEFLVWKFVPIAFVGWNLSQKNYIRICIFKILFLLTSKFSFFGGTALMSNCTWFQLQFACISTDGFFVARLDCQQFETFYTYTHAATSAAMERNGSDIEYFSHAFSSAN